MPNAVSKTKRMTTYLEDRETFEWMKRIAAERSTDVSTIIREATSAYHLQDAAPNSAFASGDESFADKAVKRARVQRWIAEVGMSPAEAQEYSAPIRGPVKMADLMGAVRRYSRGRTIR